MTSYYRVCNGVKDKGIFVPEGTDFNKFTNGEYYVSTFKYNEEQKNIFEKTGTVAGIQDVKGDILYFDLDSQNLEEARLETLKLIQRLETYFPSETINISLSGNKGFHISVHTLSSFSSEEAKSFATNIAGDLASFDSRIYNSNRLIRVEGSIHPKSKLRKTRINKGELESLPIHELQELAKNLYEYTKPQKAEITKAVKDLMIVKEVKKDSITISDKVDYYANPLKLQPWKLAISQGFFPSGTRSDSLMILASTLKNKGMNETQCYYYLKASADLQATRYNQDKFSKDEIWNNIISQVYNPNWKNGCYAEDNFPNKLKQYFEELGVPKKEFQEVVGEVINIEEKFDDFASYAIDIEKYTMRFGIKSLDDRLKVRKGHLIGMLAGPGVGKCLGYGTKVLMADGSIKEVQDIKTGDKIMGDDSTPRTVQNLARGRETMYKIHTDDDSYIVNESHILSLKGTRTWGNMTKGETINISVKEYLEKDNTFKRRTMGYRNPIKFVSKEVPFDPYLVGLWLGDGTRTKPEITSIDTEIEDYLLCYSKNNGYKLSKYECENGKCPRYNLVTERGQKNPFLDFIKSFEGRKYIPNNYKLNDFTVRKQLLAGLLDSDGHYNAKQDCYEYTSKDEDLARDVRFLCRSIGLKCTLNETSKSCGEFTGNYYRLYIKGDLTDIPMLLDRKKQVLTNQQRNPEWYRINVEKLQEDEYYGFELDGNRLFVLGDLSVTHNTSFAIELLNNTSKEGVKSLFASYDMYKHNVYQKLIQRHTGLSEDKLFEYFKNKDMKKISEFKKELVDNYKNVSFCFKSGQTIEELKKTIRMTEEASGQQLELVVVDYLELLQTEKSDPTASSAEAVNGLREIANEGRVVVTLLQPNKMSSKPDEPMLSYNAAKGSSMIAQAVTAMFTCHRPGYSSETPENDKFFSINCVKNRNGALFSLDFAWDGKTQRISEMDSEQRAWLKMLRESKAENGEEDDI